MSDDLTEVFGEDLAKNVQSKIAERREERNSVTEEQLKQICSIAINEGKFQDGDPQFSFTTENNVTHNVLLMQVPDPRNGTVWEYLDEPWDGAASLPLDYLGEWMNVTFPDKNKLADADLDPEAWFIVIGEINTYDAQDGTEKESVLAREIVSIYEAKELAQEDLADDGFAQEEEEQEVEEEPDPVEEQEPEPPEPEPEEEDDDEEEEESSGGGGLDSLLDDSDDEEEEEEPETDIDYEEVEGVVNVLADKDEQVWEVDVHDPSDDRSDKLTKIVAKEIDEDDTEAVRDVVAEVIEAEQEDDEEDDLEDSLF